MHGGHDRAGAHDDPCCEVRVEELADPFLDTRQRRRGPRSAYDGAHDCPALHECGGGLGADQTVGSGDHDDRGRS